MLMTKTCPDCGAEIPENAPNGGCPKCLFARAAGALDTVRDTAASAPPIASSDSELPLPVAPLPTVAVIWVGEFTMKLAADVPPKLTALAPVKFVPAIMTAVMVCP